MGIRKKLVIFTILAILPLGIMGVVLAGSINKNVTDLNMENYSHSNSKMIGNYQMMEQGFDERPELYHQHIYPEILGEELLPQDQVYVNRSLWYSTINIQEWDIYWQQGNEYFANKVISNVKPEDILSEELRKRFRIIIPWQRSCTVRSIKRTGRFRHLFVRNIRHGTERRTGNTDRKLNQTSMTIFSLISISTLLPSMPWLPWKVKSAAGRGGRTRRRKSAGNIAGGKGKIVRWCRRAGEVVHFAATTGSACQYGQEPEPHVPFRCTGSRHLGTGQKLSEKYGFDNADICSSLYCYVRVHHTFRKAISRSSRIMSNFWRRKLEPGNTDQYQHGTGSGGSFYNKMLKHIGTLMGKWKRSRGDPY